MHIYTFDQCFFIGLKDLRYMFKIFRLMSVVLVIGIIAFGGLVDQHTLNEVYRWFGKWLDIAWLGNGSDTTLVSDAGHGVAGFVLSSLLFLYWPSLGWRIFFGIAVFVAMIELGQFFIEKRQPSVYDFAYSMIGVGVSCMLNGRKLKV